MSYVCILFKHHEHDSRARLTNFFYSKYKVERRFKHLLPRPVDREICADQISSQRNKSICFQTNHLSRMQPTLHATRRILHGALRLMTKRQAWFGENPACSVPASFGCEVNVL